MNMDTDSNDRLRAALAADARFQSGGGVFGVIYPNHIITYIRLLRKYTCYRKNGNIFQKILSRIMLIRINRLSYKLGFYIPKDVFGPGLYIPHFGSIIVNPRAKIGSNCQINNNVVIGQVGGKAPVIGDNCFIGSGAIICGDIFIGNNCWIGANAVVTKSINEDNVLIAGNPAKIISRKESNWVEEFFPN